MDINEVMKIRQKEFDNIVWELRNQFTIKNTSYGDDYFTGNYSQLERWMSIKRKVARLQSYYGGISKDTLPDETLDDTWRDLAIYAIMELMIRKNGGDGNG